MATEFKEIEVERYTENDYEEMLRECYGDATICGMTFDAAYALKELDPIAFRCGFIDYQEYETKYECEICGEVHDDSDAAEECCVDDQTADELE